jgi:predicted GNAT family acetyltransferase
VCFTDLTERAGRRSGLADATVVLNEERRRFETRQDGFVAFLDVHRQGDVIVLVHTEVPDELEGRGIGSALVRSALEYARTNDLTVVPRCPFVRSYLERHPDEAERTKVRQP